MAKHLRSPHQTIVRATDPTGLVSAIPKLFGFEPENSLVVLPMRRKRTVGGARIELVQASDPVLSARAVLAPVASTYRPEAVLFAIFTDEPLAATPGPDEPPLIDIRTVPIPHQEVIDAFRDEAARLGIPTAVAMYIGPEGFCEYAPPHAEQTEHNALVEFWAHTAAQTHPELVGVEVEPDPRAVKRESDAKTRAVLQRLLDEREQNRLANAEARDGHEQSVDAHPHAA